MADVVENYGVTTLGDVSGDNLIVGDFDEADTIYVTVASGQGVLARGTLLQANSETGKYEVWDGTASKLAGVLNSEIDTTDGDFKTEILFDIDLNIAEVYPTSPTASVGFYPNAQIQLKEVY